ncbi:hypothetical protein [Psychroflexus sp. ALD_RP9]|uniref:hypothetical protein n=1 Tax=Psychroflexus sp. ALD_RP9 TaxID=2777186 RepID=UPI001A8FD6B3|nr:hypothetical protein [Psychroflexus sp. ALD_RP9]QSS96583.1 hypothetical protein IMZ30_09030 [Psychroflexus sp. ALD_RP9]
MALNNPKLKQDIINITDAMIEQDDYDTSKEIYADMLVAAIKDYLQSATISISGDSNQGAFTGTGQIS